MAIVLAILESMTKKGINSSVNKKPLFIALPLTLLFLLININTVAAIPYLNNLYEVPLFIQLFVIFMSMCVRIRN